MQSYSLIPCILCMVQYTFVAIFYIFKMQIHSLTFICKFCERIPFTVWLVQLDSRKVLYLTIYIIFINVRVRRTFFFVIIIWFCSQKIHMLSVISMISHQRLDIIKAKINYICKTKTSLSTLFTCGLLFWSLLFQALYPLAFIRFISVWVTYIVIIGSIPGLGSMYLDSVDSYLLFVSNHFLH